MTQVSARTRANRLNAQKSTGPKSPEGKARVAQNARVHGFCSLKRAEVTPQVERVARLIASPDADLQRLALAREIATWDEIARDARRARCLVMDRRHEPTMQDLLPLAKEVTRMRQLLERKTERREWSEQSYKGRKRNPEKNPRFRNLDAKMDDQIERLETFEMPDLAPAFEAQVARDMRLLARYEAHALRRRSRAIAAFDGLNDLTVDRT